jgi:hypothetical protein
VETIIHEGQDGSVFLKEFPDPSVRANHPLTLDSKLVQQILWGVRIHERKTMIESTLTGEAEATPAFTVAEIKFLTPLLVSAFEQATPEEAVHFRVKGEVSGKRFNTGAIMFVTEENLNLSLTEYGLTPQRPSTLSQPTKSFDRPKRWSVTFTPISVVLNAEEDKQVLGDENVPKPILISLEVLKQHAASLSEEGPVLETSTEGHRDELHPDPSRGSIKEGQTPEEMEEEIQQLRKSMQEQEERLKRLERQMGD